MSRPLTIHVGLPKTGSTALQMNLFVRHPQLAYVGRPLTRFSKAQAELFRTVTSTPVEHWEALLPEFSGRVRRLIEERPGDSVLLSDEELSTPVFDGRVGRPEVARRLATLFPEARILLIVRNQLTALPSIYHQLRRFERVPDPSFDAWATRVLADPEQSRLYDANDATSDFEATFGPERVHVLVYEAFRDEPHTFVDRLCRLVHVDPEVGRSIYLDVRRNTRPVHALHILTPPLSHALTRRFGAGNRALVARRDLALDRYGYPF